MTSHRKRCLTRLADDSSFQEKKDDDHGETPFKSTVLQVKIPFRRTFQYFYKNVTLWYESTHLHLDIYVFKMDVLVHAYARFKRTSETQSGKVLLGLQPCCSGNPGRFAAFAGALCAENLLNHRRHAGVSCL